mmetsp:Transcript_27044/g.83030  ORF Transcript_27044/g.83030 Transcript_27044/m.83030 type:complete len:230 (+) Transcript_27044:308-997(+)
MEGRYYLRETLDQEDDELLLGGHDVFEFLVGDFAVVVDVGLAEEVGGVFFGAGDVDQILEGDVSGGVEVEVLEDLFDVVLAEVAVALHGGGEEFGVVDGLVAREVDGGHELADVGREVVVESRLQFLRRYEAVAVGVDLAEDRVEVFEFGAREFARQDVEGESFELGHSDEAAHAARHGRQFFLVFVVFFLRRRRLHHDRRRRAAHNFLEEGVRLRFFGGGSLRFVDLE